MTATAETPTSPDRELVLTRVIDVPRHKLFRCWTEPELLKQWFAPKPYTTPVARIDVRPGGASYIVMRDPQGNDLPNPGVVILTFEDLGGGKTRYTARARHWTAADRETHEKMGFHA